MKGNLVYAVIFLVYAAPLLLGFAVGYDSYDISEVWRVDFHTGPHGTFTSISDAQIYAPLVFFEVFWMFLVSFVLAYRLKIDVEVEA